MEILLKYHSLTDKLGSNQRRIKSHVLILLLIGMKE